ncbi:MAG TPA: glucosaminidase domain-containing protein [Stellaceae bacterium]
MDLPGAQFLASQTDPNAVAGMLKHTNSPAAAKAVAQQFSALLMQGMMQKNDGSAIGMTEGTGNGIVNSMFASTMAQQAAKGEHMGLSDLIMRSIEKKQHLATAAGGQTPANGSSQPATIAAATMATTAETASPVAPAAAGFPLAAYWSGKGMRPLASAIASAATGSAVRPQSAAVPSPGGGGFALSPYMKVAALVPPHTPPQPPAATQPATPPSGSAVSSDRSVAAFSAKVTPLIRQAAQQLGVSPRILLAQAAIETGWGRSVVGNNLFGIKAGSSWAGATVSSGTHEYENGQYVSITDNFRAYPSYEASVQDFVSMVKNSPRYQAALGKGDDAAGYAHALLSGGWATDIDYVHKLQTVAGGANATAPFAPVPLVPPHFATIPL